MMATQNDAELCYVCKGLTFTLLRDGYTHPLTYENTVSSGKRCRLCRLIVCTMSKLQTADRCYELEKKYDSMARKLPQLPAVSRQHLHGPGFPPLVENMDLPLDVVWCRNQYIGEPGFEYELRKGNFNDGETVQFTASESLILTSSGA